MVVQPDAVGVIEAAGLGLSEAASFAVKYAPNPRYREGMATSLAVGISALSEDTGAALVMLGDTPYVAPDIVELNYGSYQHRRVYYAGQTANADPFRAALAELPPEYVGLTQQQLFSRFGIAVGGAITPRNATTVRGITGGFVAP